MSHPGGQKEGVRESLQVSSKYEEDLSVFSIIQNEPNFLQLLHRLCKYLACMVELWSLQRQVLPLNRQYKVVIHSRLQVIMFSY